MSDVNEEWVEKLGAIQEQLSSLYAEIESLRGELKTAGRKADFQAFNEPLERMARYGRLFSDIHLSWTEPRD
ncbi:MAG: hypothetical protein H0T53_08065 [Herpetosiphonaceae bacterium]|nr:hypothetical protein [Herpetosiphonaceae bacterium]